jgi:hypothetical protein
MNESSDPRGGVSMSTFVEDVFLTDAFLIKGRLRNKSKRLTNQLEDHARSFLQIDDATMVSLRGTEVIRTPTVMVNTSQIICAHELLDMTGDDAMRRLSSPNKTVRIRAFYNGAVQFELAGTIEPGAYESQQLGDRKYFIMQHPVFRGLSLERPELSMLAGLEYAIVRKDKLAYVYDFV